MSNNTTSGEAMPPKKLPSPYDILRQPDVNPGAAVTTLSYLSSRTYGLLDKWTEVKCADGTKAMILKDPNQAFEIYANEWTSKFQVVADIIEKAKVTADVELQNKVVKLFDNLNYVDATLREMYKNAYLTFAATPCSVASQKEKQKMDRIIAAIGLSLVGIKMVLETNQPSSIDKATEETLKLIDKITTILLSQ